MSFVLIFSNMPLLMFLPHGSYLRRQLSLLHQKMLMNLLLQEHELYFLFRREGYLLCMGRFLILSQIHGEGFE